MCWSLVSYGIIWHLRWIKTKCNNHTERDLKLKTKTNWREIRNIILGTRFFLSEAQIPCPACDLPHPVQGMSLYAGLYGKLPTYQLADQVLQ